MPCVNSNSINPLGILQRTSSEQNLIFVQTNDSLVHYELAIELVQKLIFLLALNGSLVVSFKDFLVSLSEQALFRSLFVLQV